MFIHESGSCIQCGDCVNVCPNKALELNGEDLIHMEERCMWCGHCLAVCPRDAIMIDGDGYDIEEVEEFNLLTRPTVKQIRRQVMMRRSIRHFNEDEVTEEELSYILEAAKYAPTGKNAQDSFLLVVETEEGRRELRENIMERIGTLAHTYLDSNPDLSAFYSLKYKMYKETGVDGVFYDAPVIIFVFSDMALDGAICAQTMMEMVDAQQGLGACYVLLAADPFNQYEDLRAKYQIPEGKTCVTALVLGHTDEEFFSSVPRKDVPIVWK